MLTKKEIEETLPHFCGTESWHKWSTLFRNYYLTDGAKYVADSCGAYWLMDAIASYYRKMLLNNVPFQVWVLDVKDNKATLTCSDGNNHTLVTQKIEYTDFPLAHIKLYCCMDSPEQAIILLPNEY